ncbi:MAG: protein kinase [Anaerolineae bacterium]|nr:protein kinase [Anaerolineae bacterium]
MARCSNCGADLVSTAKYCHQCGLPVASTSGEQTNKAQTRTLVDDQEGQTALLLDDPSADADGATALLSDSDYDASSTIAVGNFETRQSPSPTEPHPDLDTFENTVTLTRYLPEGETADPPSSTVTLGDQELPPHPSTITLDPASAADTQPAPAKAISPFDRDQLLQDRYRRLKILGRGGFGAAFLTEDTKLNRACVIKQLLTFGKSAREVTLYRTNFEREANLLVALNHPGHPNIPEIYDYFSEGDSNYLVMKYIEGRNLHDVLDQSQDKLPWREAVRYAIDVCSALDYMHNHGDEPVMHRDVKPANILLGDDGRIWLVDFGLAKANPVTDDNDSKEETRAYGSVGYSPLEQWFGQARPSSDVYAVGATIHHLITGISPLDAYEGKSNILKIKELHGKFTPIRKIDASLPKELEEIIASATDRSPEKRPTPLQLREQLRALISGAQQAALFTFKNGDSAQTVPELVDLCEQNQREAETYLQQGDFERWFLLTNRNDLAEAARKAVHDDDDPADNLERFLHLLVPNLFLRRLRKATVRVSWGVVQFVVIAAVILIPLVICGSYVGAWFLQRSIATVDWPFNTLSVDDENVYDEAFLTEKLNGIAGAYLGDVQVDTRSPDNVYLSGVLWGLPVRLPITLTLQSGQPHFELSTLNDYPLYVLGNNIADGVNSGVDEAFRSSPIDVTDMKVNDEAIVFTVIESKAPGRPDFATATPTPTATPVPTPTPTSVPVTLVVVSNELDTDVILELEIEGDGDWSENYPLTAKGTQVIEPPSGTYRYIVRYAAGGQIAARGVEKWTLNKAYRLRIGTEEQRQAIEASRPGR